MDKRYQVFVSSTYADLKEERRKVIQTLMEMDCIPAGMEMFPAFDEEQFNFIKRIIDDSDYYILVIGGRYGSLTPEGISYTEQEFDYAIQRGLKVIAFLHGSPETLMVAQTDNNPELAKRLLDFRAKAQTGRLVRYWQSAEELPGLVSLSLHKTIKTYPAIGWVRATEAGSSELLAQINALRLENEQLRLRAPEIQEKYNFPEIADMSESVNLHGTCGMPSPGSKSQWSDNITWQEIFSAIAPALLSNPLDAAVNSTLATAIYEKKGMSGDFINLNEQDFLTVKVQLRALGLVEVTSIAPGAQLRWSLTPAGESKMMELRVIKSKV